MQRQGIAHATTQSLKLNTKKEKKFPLDLSESNAKWKPWHWQLVAQYNYDGALILFSQTPFMLLKKWNTLQPCFQT